MQIVNAKMNFKTETFVSYSAVRELRIFVFDGSDEYSINRREKLIKSGLK